jgi:signal transduction histidine kinase/HAMP domain-containing protein
VALQTTAIQSQGQTARNQMVVIFVTALVLVFAIGYLTSNMITGRVQHLMENALAVAQGDFSRRTYISAEDEIGSLARSLNEMTVSLAEYTTALQNKIAELTALYESSTAVTVKSSLNLDQVLDAVANGIRDVMRDADQVVIHLLNEDNKQLEPIHASPEAAVGFPSYKYEENGRIDSILTTARPQFIQLAEIEELSLNGRPFASELAESRRALITPLVTGHETIGMLTLTFSSSGRHSTMTQLGEDSARLLGTFANQAAIAIKNAQLFEETQEAYEELQQLDRLKTEFINIAAHELRTPLGAILGHASSIEKRAPPNLKKYISFIVISALRMRTMIDAMLTIQRLDAGTAFLKVSMVEINTVINKVVTDYRPMAELEGHRMNVYMAEGLPKIEIDAEKIGLVLSNLISNAIKFTPEEGQIDVTSQDYGDSILVTVRDTGIGISPENQKQVFERFYQVSSEEMMKYGNLGVGAGHGGMGIGLTIAKHLVELHQGEVWVESEPGRGSTFFVTIPKTMSKIQQTTQAVRLSA